MKPELQGKIVVFTGTLITMTRKEAQALVMSVRGNIANHVSKETNILVVGHYSKSLFDQEKLTKKEALAQSYEKEGFPIRLINEKTFITYIINDLKMRHLSLAD